jgi:hypothetical protein
MDSLVSVLRDPMARTILAIVAICVTASLFLLGNARSLKIERTHYWDALLRVALASQAEGSADRSFPSWESPGSLFWDQSLVFRRRTLLGFVRGSASTHLGLMAISRKELRLCTLQSECGLES